MVDPVRPRPASALWPVIARRVVEGVNVQPDELVLVRDGAGDLAALEEILLAVEAAGATPLPEILHAGYLGRLLAEVDPVHLARWDRHRMLWAHRCDRAIRLQGLEPDLAGALADALRAWDEAIERLTVAEEERRRPFLMVAVPTADRARALGMTPSELESVVLPALAVPVADLRAEIERALGAVRGARALTLRTGEGCELRLALDERPWLSDDGVVDEADRAVGAGVSNLPGGSIYSTVLEDATEGRLWLPEAGATRDVTLHFREGRVVEIEAREGAAELGAMFDRHGGESRRISHVGIGLNPALRRAIGWVLVDEHVHGALFVAFGENRYMGGENASSLNVDFCVPDATIYADDRAIVREGRVVVT